MLFSCLTRVSVGLKVFIINILKLYGCFLSIVFKKLFKRLNFFFIVLVDMKKGV